LPPERSCFGKWSRFLDLTFGYLFLQFIMLTYIFMLAWLGVTAFTSLPVFMYFNIWTICQNMTVLEGASLCLDPRQFGMFTVCRIQFILIEFFQMIAFMSFIIVTLTLDFTSLQQMKKLQLSLLHFLMSI
uniref:Uncharacterized protein n=1 Tax=Cyprinus carpio TaxID=7962 RepID=A0A8C2I4J9_CYPCA